METLEKITMTELSQQFGLPPSTLRYYEEVDLLKNVERAGKHRLFNQTHIGRLEAIQCFKQTGMSIKQIRDFFYYEDQTEEYQQLVKLLEEHAEKIEEQLAELKTNQAHIQQKLAYYQAKKTAHEAKEKGPDWEQYQ